MRRQFNQGLFKALWINTDGNVERYEMTEPFGMLLDPDGVKQGRPILDVGRTGGAADEDQIRSSWMISEEDLQKTHPDDGIGRVGSNNVYMVPPAGFEPATIGLEVGT